MSAYSTRRIDKRLYQAFIAQRKSKKQLAKYQRIMRKSDQPAKRGKRAKQ